MIQDALLRMWPGTLVRSSIRLWVRFWGRELGALTFVLVFFFGTVVTATLFLSSAMGPCEGCVATPSPEADYPLLWGALCLTQLVVALSVVVTLANDGEI